MEYTFKLPPVLRRSHCAFASSFERLVDSIHVIENEEEKERKYEVVEQEH